MTATQGDLAALSKYIFRAPRWYTSVAFALVVAAFAGMGVFHSAYVLEDVWEGVFYVGLPTVVAALFTTPVDRALGGQLTYNRSSLLALTCELLVVAVLLAAGGVAILTGYGQQFVFDALIASLSLVFAVRLLAVLAVSRNSWLAVFPAAIQTAAAAVLLFVYSGTMRFLSVGGPLTQAFLSRSTVAPAELLVVTPSDFLLLGVTSAMYAGVTYGFVRVVDRPWQRALGVSLLDFVRGFVGHIAEGSRELEDFFETIGEEAVVPVTVLSFRRPGGDEKARFVLPMIHPGPMGNIGGGDLPVRVAETAEGLAFPPHATAGHDFNLVTEREVGTVVDAVGRAAADLDMHDEASAPVRTESGDASVLGQAFGDDALFVSTFAPGFADDVSFAVGQTAAAEARCRGLDVVMLADAHNSNNGLEGPDLGHVNPGDQRSFDLFEAVRTGADALADADRSAVHLGVAHDETAWGPADGIGPLGVRVAAVEAGGGVAVYVLVDGNNMEPGLRDRLVGAVRDATAADCVEVMTTDNHVVNRVESTNQVGEHLDESTLETLVVDLAADALGDRERVEAGMASERATVTVFGNDRTETLASHANAVVGMAIPLGGMVVLTTVLVTVVLFFLT